jgi:hypothetical protein
MISNAFIALSNKNNEMRKKQAKAEQFIQKKKINKNY